MKIRIERDDDPSSPREWDNLGRMVCFHRSYNLGDKHDYNTAHYDGWAAVRAAITKEENAVVILPLFLFDHSGITMSCSTDMFRAADSHGWDWGCVGFIFARREDVLKEYGKKRITKKTLENVTKVLVGEVETYDLYLTGDVWGYIVEDDDGEHLDSCWGFYGREYCEKEAADMVTYLEQQAKEAALRTKATQSAMPCCQP